MAGHTGLDIAALTEWHEDAMDRQMKPDPVVSGFLAHLNERQAPWGIVTNGPSEMQRHKCQALGLDQIAPFIIVSDEVGCSKPDLRIFNDALDENGLNQPERVMFVGDNPHTDINGARRASVSAPMVT